ncbi:hypothetical protein SEA_YABOI_205 [Streptomyces phage Yaboi]|uniref:Uncharacterized protein n=2 Tax=Streptomyces virus Yaboi TaxID=2846408 RepID=A0A385UGX6_9CAUD|nr:hypothetical protein HWB86_gp117 [Streptomyces phage Yaboi]AYB71002.1 hypothetical protein SEA_YABOI_205 [Streptomyces phage Yaboi]QAY08826.1 hypothetical protein SEA_GENIE2_200 [Streptomyces phage Genie2]UVD40010.1 hypothetical protein SEA_STANIMAL_200 [Streptomyces phage Stanimal]WNM73752.1 hypothetical protein SEA_SOLLERTIA_201 [Streptomyces phage Sollertia]
MSWFKSKKGKTQQITEPSRLSLDILDIPGIDDEIDQCVCAEDFLDLLEKYRKN